MELTTIKFQLGQYLVPLQTVATEKSIFFKFSYNKKLIEEIKAFDGAKWHPNEKLWSVHNNSRNKFQLDYLQGKNPYKVFDIPLVSVTSKRVLYTHQVQMVQQILTRKACILACEMGLGKTLAAIEAAEIVHPTNLWYIGPRAGVKAVERELVKWESNLKPRMMTYEQVTKLLQDASDITAPDFIIFDECSKIKTPTAQRSQACMHLAEESRKQHITPYIVGMSGTPAPKSPIDWWNQCISGESLISTTQGLIIAKNLKKPFEAVVNGRVYQASGFWSNGIKDTYKLVTKEGYELKCTENHKVLVDYFGLQIWKEVNQLKIEDKLILNNNKDFSWNGLGTFNDGYLLGLIFGDGHVYKGTKCATYFACIGLWYDDDSIQNIILSMLPTNTHLCKTDKKEKMSIHGSYLSNLVREWGIKQNKQIDENILQSSSDFQKGFLRGLFDSDGTVELNRLRLSFCQTDYNRMFLVGQMLSNFGIKCKIRKHLASKNSYIEKRKINSKDSYILLIDNQSAIQFEKQIGFFNKYKAIRLRQGIVRHHNWDYSHSCEIKEIIKIDKQEVYDCKVEDIHCFSANGIIVHNCEVICPGYIKEGNIHKFKNRLCIIENKESITGGTYPHIVTWKDDSTKCNICGQTKESEMHDVGFAESINATQKSHEYKASRNEVSYLYERMKGLVLVQYKKDCTDLPEKQYQIIKIKPSIEILQAAKLIKATSSRVIEALTRLRELCDGFQYKESEVGTAECPNCYGEGVENDYNQEQKIDGSYDKITCSVCNGTKTVGKFERVTSSFGSPKDEVVKEMLDEHEEVGRFIIWGGFTGTIDRLVTLVTKLDWAVLRVDGRGYHGFDLNGNQIDANILLSCMDKSDKNYGKLLEQYPRVCFIGHPQAGGMALTLTASPTELFYSNCFNGEARMQAEDRFHRMGMDMNRGAMIVDLIMLQTDELVLENLKRKKRLQELSMGELNI